MSNQISAPEFAEKLKAKLEELAYDPGNEYIKNDIRNLLFYAMVRTRENSLWGVDFITTTAKMGIDLQAITQITDFKE